MLKFVRRNTVPPGRVYFYQVPGINLYLEHHVFSALEDLVRKTCAANNIHVSDNLAMEIEDYMCRYLPDTFCTGIPDPEKEHLRALTRDEINHRTHRLVYSGLDTKEDIVTPEKANTRARICANCPNNGGGLCSVCAGFKLKWSTWLGNRATLLDDYLGACTADGALTFVKIWIPESGCRRAMNKAVEDLNKKGRYMPQAHKECWCYDFKDK